MKKRRAMALVTVLMGSLVLLILVLTGVQMAGRNLFTMSRVHERNMALYAAEAGVYKTIAEIEALDRYPSDGLRPRVELSNGASYQVDLRRSGDSLILRSTGQTKKARRTLEITLNLSADSFMALASEGRIAVSDDIFINAIESMANPKNLKGNIHTNSNDNDAIYNEQRDSRASVTGLASSVGQITADIVGSRQPRAARIDSLAIDRDTLIGTSPYTTITEIPADGQIRGHLRIAEVDWEGTLHVEAGAVLHVTGDAAFARGITGEGTVVVDGECLLRASPELDERNPKGVMLYAGQGAAILHPQARRETLRVTTSSPPDPTPENPNPPAPPSVSRETYVQQDPDPVAEFFASRPPDTEFNLRQGLPVNAPTDLEFFEYLEREELSPSEAFQLWMEGDGTPENPGLRPEVKAWVKKSNSRNNPELSRKLREMRAER
jgi:hypothetical protein